VILCYGFLENNSLPNTFYNVNTGLLNPCFVSYSQNENLFLTATNCQRWVVELQNQFSLGFSHSMCSC